MGSVKSSSSSELPLSRRGQKRPQQKLQHKMGRAFRHQVAGGTEQPSSRHHLFFLLCLLLRWSMIYLQKDQLCCSLCKSLTLD